MKFVKLNEVSNQLTELNLVEILIIFFFSLIILIFRCFEIIIIGIVKLIKFINTKFEGKTKIEK